METSTVTQKGQIVIPIRLRKEYGIKQGTKIAFTIEKNTILIKPISKKYFNNIKGITKTNGKLLKSLIADKKQEKLL